eukprot:10556458-Alexandrium_andersonii.AAC.1
MRPARFCMRRAAYMGQGRQMHARPNGAAPPCSRPRAAQPTLGRLADAAELHTTFFAMPRPT